MPHNATETSTVRFEVTAPRLGTYDVFMPQLQ